MTERLQNPRGVRRIETREGVAEIDRMVSARGDSDDQREHLPLAGRCRRDLEQVRGEVPIDSCDARVAGNDLAGFDRDRLAAKVRSFKPPLVCDEQAHGGFCAVRARRPSAQRVDQVLMREPITVVHHFVPLVRVRCWRGGSEGASRSLADDGTPRVSPGAALYRRPPSTGNVCLRRYHLLVEPRGDRVGVEAQQIPPLDVGNSALRDQLANMTDTDAQVSGHSRDVHQVRQLARGVTLPGVRRPATPETSVTGDDGRLRRRVAEREAVDMVGRA
jgi:hypothetical protein